MRRYSVEQQFEKVMETITKFFKEEKDFLYRKGEVTGKVKGIVKGREEKEREVVTNLIVKLVLPDEQVARIAEVPLSLVKSVRDELKNREPFPPHAKKPCKNH